MKGLLLLVLLLSGCAAKPVLRNAGKALERVPREKPPVRVPVSKPTHESESPIKKVLEGAGNANDARRWLEGKSKKEEKKGGGLFGL